MQTKIKEKDKTMKKKLNIQSGR